MNVSPGADSGAVGRWLARVCTWAEGLAILMLLVMTALIILQVGGRNLLNLGWPWAEELARYAGLGLVYLTAPLLLLRDKHIQVDIVSARIPGLAGRWLRVVNEALVLAFCCLFLWGGWAFLKKAGQFSTPALGIPNTVYYLPALLGMLLLAVVSLYRLLRLSAALRSATQADGATP
ncbi:MAG: TRAP transporter small permease [Rhodoferax sp.]|jgi:TRAP-type C4-dicarboxylate transport system permease small subunit|nr:TRAP transporter small permease [Rhodoferax sp.]